MTSLTPRAALTAGSLTVGGLMVAGFTLFFSGAAIASPSASPSASDSDTITTAGTSFLTATSVDIGQSVEVTASTGDYLYWSFDAEAGQTGEIAATVTLPEAADRLGSQTWAIEVFDGLRRRQACTAGAQTATAATTDASLTLGCSLREVRSWAEPWSGDPLPGTYYVRLSATDLLEEDLGQTIEVAADITATDSGDPEPEGGDMAVPLVPADNAGSAQATASPSPSVSASADSDWLPDLPDASGWLPEASTRWIWTSLGGILAAIGGLYGFRLTRRPRRRSMA